MDIGDIPRSIGSGDLLLASLWGDIIITVIFAIVTILICVYCWGYRIFKVSPTRNTLLVVGVLGGGGGGVQFCTASMAKKLTL